MKTFALLTCVLLATMAYSARGDETDEPTATTPAPEAETESGARKRMTFKLPETPKSAFFVLYFTSSSDLTSRMTQSAAKKDGVDDHLSKYDGVWSVEVPHSSAIDEDYALVLKSKARHHAIAISLDKPVDFSKDQLVVQYEVKFQNAMDCGGAYVKLLSEQPNFELKSFNDKTPYTIMFGPDKCGMDHKIHFIFRHKSPITGEYEEKHAKKCKAALDRFFSDQKSHLYTLVINSDNTFEIYVDQNQVNSGSLLSDFEPAVNPPKEVEDPNDKKPEDWDEREKIVDPEAKKPDDWDESQPEMIEDKDAIKPEGWLEDEPLLIPDPTSEKPKDWDQDMDGDWEAPKIDNPKCKDGAATGCGPWVAAKIKNALFKGKWTAPLLSNPNFKGAWKAKRVLNPNYFEDEQPYRRMTPIVALGLELWSMTQDIAFDNFYIGSSKKEADDFAAETWYTKSNEERKADPQAQSVIDAIQEVTRDKPWVWGIVALVVVLPVLLIVWYCCTGNSAPTSSRVQMRHKKTDEITPDASPSSPGRGAAAAAKEGAATNGDGAVDEADEEKLSSAEASPEGKARSRKADLESDSDAEEEKTVPPVVEAAANGDASPEKRVTKRQVRKE